MTDIQSRRFRGHDGIALAADCCGDESNPIVLLLHGGGQTRHSWRGTAVALAKRGWHAITIDGRGHGESDWDPAANYTLLAFTHDLKAIIDQLARPVFLVGASLGGSTTMTLEGEVAPGSAQAAVLVDIVPRYEIAGTNRIADFMRDRIFEGFATLEEARDAIAAYNPHRPPPSDLEGLKKNLRLGDDGRWRWHYDPKFVMGLSGPGEVGRFDIMSARARNMKLPVLLVRGRMSDVVSMEGVQSFLEDVPHAEFVDVSGAGHMVAGDRNDIFTDAVVEFLDRHHA